MVYWIVRLGEVMTVESLAILVRSANPGLDLDRVHDTRNYRATTTEDAIIDRIGYRFRGYSSASQELAFVLTRTS